MENLSFAEPRFLLSIRSNGFCPLPTRSNGMNSLISYRRRPTIVFRMGIFGFPSSPIHPPIGLLAFNDALAVLFYYSARCYSTSCTTIYPLKRDPPTKTRATVYPLVLCTSLLNRYVLSIPRPSISFVCFRSGLV